MQWPGEKLLEKLWDSIADKGIGALLKPWQMRREGTVAAEIKRLTLLTEAQAEVDMLAIRSGKRTLLANGTLSELTNVEETQVASTALSLQEAHLVAAHNAKMENLRREISVAKAVAYAESALAQDEDEPSSIPLSDDWLLRWRENAATVSSEELQILWGKVLAGEVKAPGQFSLRVLDFLRNLSQNEAQELQLLASVATGEVVLRCDSELTALGLTPVILAAMQELGILNGAGVGGLGLTRQIPSELPDRYQSVIYSATRALIVTSSDSAKSIQMPCYQVTRLGQQVLKLAGNATNNNYFRAVGHELSQQGFEVAVGDFYLFPGNRYEVRNMVFI